MGATAGRGSVDLGLPVVSRGGILGPGSRAHQGGDGKAAEQACCPGLYPGHVVEVRNPPMCRTAIGTRRRSRRRWTRGIKELTGATDGVEAWKHFFEPGDVVGIKVVPNGQPDGSIPRFEIVLEVIESSRRPASRTSDIFVYDRYRASSWTPAITRSSPPASAGAGWTPRKSAHGSDFPGSQTDPIAGLRPRCVRPDGLDPLRRRPQGRPQLSLASGQLRDQDGQQDRGHPVAQRPWLGGRHGSSQEHEPRHGQQRRPLAQHTFTNVCNQFIPQVVSHPIIRQKFVLQIMDGIRGVYQGGPFSAKHGNWTWEYNAIFFATDPVALDHVEWGIIDAKRQEEGLPPVAATGRRDRPAQDRGLRRAPAPAHRPGRCLGLGYFDFKSPKGRRFLDPAPGRERLSRTVTR